MTDTNTSQLTITEIVSLSGDGFDNNDQDFDILLAALQTAGLAETLDDPEVDLTVFAPTDEAFVKLAQDFGYRGIDEAEAFDTIVNTLTVLGDGDPIPLLTDILLYHVSPDAKNQAELSAQGTIETLLEGATFLVEGQQLVDNEPDLLSPTAIPLLSNIHAQNGIIQGIDRVLIPLDIEGNDSTFILGSNAADIINGASGSSTIQGLGGDDVLLGSSADDQLIGDEGDDVLLSMGGNDIFRGGDGDDIIISTADNGLPGNNLIDSGAGNDQIILGNGLHTIVLEEGDGFDIVNNFNLGETTFALAGDIAFEDLTIQQGPGFSVIAVGTDILAQVVDVAASDLSDIANFA